MFKKIMERLEALAASREDSFDPSRFDDPVAMKTSWMPLKRGGANFGTHKLVESGSRRLEFKSSFGSKAFSFIFLAVGVGTFFGGIVNLFVNSFSEFGPSLFLIPFGAVFGGVGFLIGFFMCMPSVFDKKEDLFWKGWKTPERGFGKEDAKNSVDLGEVYALQIIHEWCSGDKSSYYSYELNLVMKDGSRMNVVDHGNLEGLQQDVQKLSQFLEKPVWDASGG